MRFIVSLQVLSVEEHMTLTAQHPHGHAAQKAMDQRQMASAKASKACLVMSCLDGRVLIVLCIGCGITRMVATIQYNVGALILIC